MKKHISLILLALMIGVATAGCVTHGYAHYDYWGPPHFHYYGPYYGPVYGPLYCY